MNPQQPSHQQSPTNNQQQVLGSPHASPDCRLEKRGRLPAVRGRGGGLRRPLPGGGSRNGGVLRPHHASPP